MATEFKLSHTAEEINEKLQNAAEIKTMTSAEYDLLAEPSANTLYMLTDAEEEVDTSVLYTEQELTEEQKAQARENIGAISDTELAEELAKRGQLAPEYADSIEECTDTTKLYVLPDGMIYAYMLTEVESAPTYTNILPLAVNADGTEYVGDNGEDGYRADYRLNSSGAEVAQSGVMVTGFIPAKAGDIIRIKNFTPNTAGYGYLFPYKSDFTKYGNAVQGSAMASGIVDGVYLLDTSTFPAETAYIRFSASLISEDTIVTANEEITESDGTTAGYAWTSTGHAFVPADYEDRIITLEEEVGDLKEAVNNGVALVDKSTMFISPDGDDSNSGLTASAPKKTVAACVSAGATRISAKRGVYAENISLYNVGELEIFPTDNDQEYSTTEEWPPIVFDTSDSLEVSGFEAYNDIKRIAYSNSNNTQFDKVFTAQSQDPVISDYGSRYNATVWLMSSDKTAVCIKLKPVLTVAECEAETNTFSYVDDYIYINADWTDVESVVVPTNWGSGFRIQGAEKVVLREVEVRFSGSYNLWLLNCPYFDFYKCAAKYTSYASGFDIDNANGIFNNCYATKNYDGFGISGYGHTTYIDCVSEFNFDDGVSHHNGTEGTFIGGRYEGNGKGGNTPAYGAKVNIYGGIYKNNASFGIGYLYTSTHNPASGIIHGAVMVGNPVGLSVNANCNVTAISCVYKNNTTDKNVSGTLTEY